MQSILNRLFTVPLDVIAEPAVSPTVVLLIGAVIISAIVTVIAMLIVRKPKHNETPMQNNEYSQEEEK